MSTEQGMLSPEQTALAAISISLLVLCYTAAVFMCGRTCCVEHPRYRARPFLAARRQQKPRAVDATELSTPFARGSSSESSEDIVQRNE